MYKKLAELIDCLKQHQGALTLHERCFIYNLLSDAAYELIQISHPVLNVKLVPQERVIDNDYNPNKVASPEYRLLSKSIKTDGLTMPVVVGGHDAESQNYYIVDGYHRSKLIKSDSIINESLNGLIPVSILDSTLDQRMASSVRHNVARGVHQVDLTANLIVKLKAMNWLDEDIASELGMDKDEVLRMQQTTGLAEAFKDHTFSKAWE
ncbi:chromosome partitioning protein ParB [Shewanella maritima]|uniref:Chromosome partitioning protein ParB n=1 Tax=Shewanella maritima TaxID=2520507 RepID=A0A411PGL5_9GAMM|nr:ParB/RepB/Spo0J family partition protein [Shewanella maritima]QBF82638.1 chromosome partitioning protein ParB [Shewanella maritima]